MALLNQLLLLLLPLLISNGVFSAPDGGAPLEPSPGSSEISWQILTKRNFSSQIRSHPHILLLVALPWHGETRSLKKNVVDVISKKKGRLYNLKLMVVHKNSEKMLADVLGAKKDLTLFYYHYSKRFQYQGRLNARSIVESVLYIMSLEHKDVPLVPLHFKEQLKVFLNSTDEAILLLDFCNWSSRVTYDTDIDNSGGYHYMQDFSKNGDFLGGDISVEDESLQSGDKGKTKESEDVNMSCSVESDLSGSSWLEDVFWPTQNVSLGMGGRHVRDGHRHSDCSRDEFKHFESFFLNLSKVMRETLLPPERRRFGYISEASLLPIVGVEKPKSWMLLRWVSGCPNCSETFREGDDLRSFVQMEHSIIVDLDGDKGTNDHAFPANQPSIILFIDRWSESSQIVEQSKNALGVFRSFVHENQPYRKTSREFQGVITRASMLQSSKASSKKVTDVQHPFTNLLSGSNVIKVTDQMSIMVVDGSRRVSLKRETVGHDTSAYNILANFLQQEDSTSNKEKMRLIAKEFGFQLISDDFEIRNPDFVTEKNENGLLDSGSSDSSAAFPMGPTESHQIVREDSTEPGDFKLVGSSGPHLDQLERLEEKANVFNSTDTSKDEKSFGSKDDGLDNHHSGGSFCNQQDLPEIEGFFSTKFRHSKNDISTELKSHVDGQSSSKTTNVAFPLNMEFHMGGMGLEVQKEKHSLDFQFSDSCFVSDGGYRMVRALTGDTKLPSIVILDPTLHRHYVLSGDTNLSYSVLVNFVSDFLKGKLSPHQRSGLIPIPRHTLEPPFVNLDFHEVDAIPRVTAESFSELVLGCNDSNKGIGFPYHKTFCCSRASNRDVLVLFSHSWCGYCLRMELIVREVYRAFQGLTSLLKIQRMNEDNFEDISSNLPELPPLIFYMDCTLNVCSFFLNSSLKGDVYPTLVLFPVGKDTVLYEGNISVNGIFEFIAAHGVSSSNMMNEYKGILWTQSINTREAFEKNRDHDDAYPISFPDTISLEDRDGLLQPVGNPLNLEEEHDDLDMQLADESHIQRPSVAVGSILLATDKLINAFPFDNSSVLIVKADHNTSFQGLILNKHIDWNVFMNMDKSLHVLKQAPLSYGGPVKAVNMPLVTLTRKAMPGYVKVTDEIYYGDPMATGLIIEDLLLGNKTSTDFWFFLGFSSWHWNQLYGEIARGDWDLGKRHFEILVWPQV